MDAIPDTAPATLPPAGARPEGEAPPPERPAPGVCALPGAPHERTRARSTPQRVLDLCRWSRTLLAVRVTRDPSFRFTPGHYARLGLPDEAGRPLFRPLSVASAPADAHLEFLCTLVPGGAFSARLDALRAGDAVEVERPSYGFLTVDALAPGPDLWLIASGTGLAPYLSMLRDAAAWSRFERLVVVHSVRRAADRACADELRGYAKRPPFGSGATFRYVPVVTREPRASRWSRRIPALLADESLPAALGMQLDPGRSRVLVCGHPDLARDMRTLLAERGFRTSRRGAPGQMAFEKYW